MLILISIPLRTHSSQEILSLTFLAILSLQVLRLSELVEFNKKESHLVDIRPGLGIE